MSRARNGMTRKVKCPRVGDKIQMNMDGKLDIVTDVIAFWPDSGTWEIRIKSKGDDRIYARYRKAIGVLAQLKPLDEDTRAKITGVNTRVPSESGKIKSIANKLISKLTSDGPYAI